MAIAFVSARGAGNNATTATTIAVTPTGTISVGNCLIVATGQTSDTLTGVADTQGNTYQVNVTNGANNRSTGIAHSIITTQLTTSDTITATFSTTTTDRSITLAEFSGVLTTSPFDQGTTAAGTGVTPDSGNISTTTAGQLLIGVFEGNSGATAYTPGTTGVYTFLEISEQAPARINEVMYAIVGAAGTYSANGVIISAAWTQSVASYKAATAPSSIKKVSGTAVANIKKINGIAIANIKKINGVANT